MRFNWDFKLGKTALYELTSMDYWSSKNIDFERPTRSVRFASQLNVLQVLSAISDALLSGSINEANEALVDVNLMLEKRTSIEKSEWMKSNGLPASYTKEDKMRLKVGKAAPHLSDQLEVFLGSAETNSFSKKLKDAEKQFDKTVYANPETVFEDIEDLLSLVAAKKWRTLIVCGAGGIGKTYHITEGPRSLKALLGSEGGKWTYHSGVKASPLAFYKTLFLEREQIIVFDEADALLKHSEIVMMLKPILDTSGKNMAEYLTGTANMVGKTEEEIEKYSDSVVNAIKQGATIVKHKTGKLWDPLTQDLETNMSKFDVMLPSKFVFKGGMIFISNMKAAQIEQAIMSRSIFIDVYLAERDVLKRIQSIGYAIAKNTSDVSSDDVDEVLSALGESNTGSDHEITYMTPEYARKSKQVTVRALQLGLILQKSGLSRWVELTALYA